MSDPVVPSSDIGLKQLWYSAAYSIGAERCQRALKVNHQLEGVGLK